MLFNSLEYALFLALVFFAFWGLGRAQALRTALLLGASYLFYMSWNASFVFLLAASTLVDYWIGNALARRREAHVRRALVTGSIVLNLGLLAVFKYLDFGLSAVSTSLSGLGLHVAPVHLGLIVPVGISFYTFQTLSYTIDIYRGRLAPAKSFLDFATYVAFFPQLVAGPIVRASEFLPQLERPPRLDAYRAGSGMVLIFRGLAKKVLVADFLAVNWIDRVFDSPGAYSTVEVWFTVIAYSVQIYADFSGYTDIARGSARLLGYELPINFRRPLASTGFIQFWERWHITLSTWIRDYLYVPLGGSRRGRGWGYANLFIAFLFTGIWHGAGWTFLCFALFHAFAVLINRLYREARGHRRGDVVTGFRRVGLIALFNVALAFHWPTFRAEGARNMLDVYGRLLAFDSAAFRVGPAVVAITVLAFAVHLTPPTWAETARDHLARLPAPVQAGLAVAVTALLVWVGGEQAAPFIYFQF